MDYAKLIDNEIQFAPRKLTVEMTVEIDGESVTDLYTVYNPTAEQYASQGWLPVVEYDMPDNAPDGYHYEPFYTEFNGRIVQSWVQVEDEPPDPNPEISAERAINIILTGRDNYEA